MNTGGPAFPVPDSHHANGQVQYGANGMTLLDWMAGQALVGLVSESGRYDSSGAASDAYNFSAAMLAEKARRESNHSDGTLGMVPHREVDNDYWAKFQDGIRIVFQPTNGWCAEIREGSMGCGNTIAEAVANLRARWEERSVVPDHSPDAGKMAALEAANSELVEELEKFANAVELFTGYGPEVQSARVILAKHKGAE